MPLSRMGGSAFDLDKIAAVVRHKPPDSEDDHVTVYLSEAVAVELFGDDARAFLRFVDSLPPKDADLGPVGSRVAVAQSVPLEGRETPGRKQGR